MIDEFTFDCGKLVCGYIGLIEKKYDLNVPYPLKRKCKIYAFGTGKNHCFGFM